MKRVSGNRFSAIKQSTSPVAVNRYQNIKSKYASNLLLETSTRVAHSKKPSIFETETRIDERDTKDEEETFEEATATFVVKTQEPAI